MPAALQIVRAGAGPTLLFVHGSAADHTTWAIQLASPLRTELSLIAYDRRRGDLTVEDHARDALALLAQEPRPALIIGSSFGAVIALEVVRQHADAVAGAVLIEPPMGPSDDLAPAASGFVSDLDRIAATHGGPAAAEQFLRRVLGDAVLARMPRASRDRAIAKWAEIRADSAALLAYRPRYDELRTIATPVLLLGGERSPPSYRATLDALAAALPRARLATVPRAGHMLHAEAHRTFSELVGAFAAEVGVR